MNLLGKSNLCALHTLGCCPLKEVTTRGGVGSQNPTVKSNTTCWTSSNSSLAYIISEPSIVWSKRKMWNQTISGETGVETSHWYPVVGKAFVEWSFFRKFMNEIWYKSESTHNPLGSKRCRKIEHVKSFIWWRYSSSRIASNSAKQIWGIIIYINQKQRRCLPSQEVTYLYIPYRGTFPNDVPFFPRWDMLVSRRVLHDFCSINRLSPLKNP